MKEQYKRNALYIAYYQQRVSNASAYHWDFLKVVFSK